MMGHAGLATCAGIAAVDAVRFHNNNQAWGADQFNEPST